MQERKQQTANIARAGLHAFHQLLVPHWAVFRTENSPLN